MLSIKLVLGSALPDLAQARPVFTGRRAFFNLNCVVRLCRAAEAWIVALRYDGCIEAREGEAGTDGTETGLRAISFMALPPEKFYITR